ncbi:hypothetical protein E2562_028846 [Oryza meyeriana var. granulata]|uniref:Uncharacterized protein n=1 Tax=Oryza meyeriana var. granulata TaxID=110450 RepID=A0A6G1FDG3_9ORYZ|nr:hypothetical protein E2562_028846 [Oryza meyeriana var. granulata]
MVQRGFAIESQDDVWGSGSMTTIRRQEIGGGARGGRNVDLAVGVRWLRLKGREKERGSLPLTSSKNRSKTTRWCLVVDVQLRCLGGERRKD